jgi:hypothetical protein
MSRPKKKSIFCKLGRHSIIPIRRPKESFEKEVLNYYGEEGYPTVVDYVCVRCKKVKFDVWGELAHI